MFESDEKVNPAFLVDDVNDLIKNHNDLIVSYKDVFSRSKSDKMKQVVEVFIEQHGVQIASLAEFVSKLGGDPARDTDSVLLGVKMRIAAGQIFHNAGMYSAMQANEEKLALEYERALKSLSNLSDLEAILTEHFIITRERVAELAALVADEQHRHKANVLR